MKLKGVWIATAAILTIVQLLDGRPHTLQDGVYTLSCILFFYLSWICELLRDRGN